MLSCNFLSQFRLRSPTRLFFSLSKLSNNSHSDISRKVSQINEVLANIKEPSSNQSLLHFSQNVLVEQNGAVSIDLDLLVPGHPYLNNVTQIFEQAVRKVSWVKNVSLNILSKINPNIATNTSSTVNIQGIRNIVAVSSCKGGVGKSTVAVNLAFALAKRGLRVGILDADIYGPSLPYMVQPISDVVRRSPSNPKNILPLETSHGIKMLSFGHVSPKSGVQGAGGREAAVLRGPVASKVITQMISSTEWGDLDYLLVDTPPGTGDIQITLSQTLPFAGAVVVTTPHTLSLVDAAKGVAMFQQMHIPTLALVENMSYFVCRHGEKHFPFGEGGRDNLLKGLYQSALQQLGNVPSNSSTSGIVGSGTDSLSGPIASVFSRLSNCPLHTLPLSSEASSPHRSDNIYNSSSIQATHNSGSKRSQSLEVEESYNRLADDVILEIFKLKLLLLPLPTISFVEGSSTSGGIGEVVLREITPDSAVEHRIPVGELRIRDPITGKRYPGSSTDDVMKFSGITPVHFDRKGNYGVAINWSDGHYADIFPYAVLRSIAAEIKNDSIAATVNVVN